MMRQSQVAQGVFSATNVESSCQLGACMIAEDTQYQPMATNHSDMHTR